MNPVALSELQATATLFDDRAGRLEAAADLLATRAATATWSGPAADRFRLLMVQRRTDVRTAAAALRDAASAMRTAAVA